MIKSFENIIFICFDYHYHKVDGIQVLISTYLKAFSNVKTKLRLNFQLVKNCLSNRVYSIEQQKSQQSSIRRETMAN